MKQSKTRSTLLHACLSGALFIAPVVQAHHSFAMYDTSESYNFSGKLTRFIPGANHAQIIFQVVDDKGNDVIGEDGKPLVWGIETGPSAAIARQGVTVKAFPEGTFINVTVNPLRDGRTFGLQNGVIIKCGSTMPEGGCNAETGESFMAPRN